MAKNRRRWLPSDLFAYAGFLYFLVPKYISEYIFCRSRSLYRPTPTSILQFCPLIFTVDLWHSKIAQKYQKRRKNRNDWRKKQNFCCLPAAGTISLIDSFRQRTVPSDIIFQGWGQKKKKEILKKGKKDCDYNVFLRSF